MSSCLDLSIISDVFYINTGMQIYVNYFRNDCVVNELPLAFLLYFVWIQLLHCFLMQFRNPFWRPSGLFGLPPGILLVALGILLARFLIAALLLNEFLS